MINHFSSSDLQQVQVQVQVEPDSATSLEPPNDASLFSKTEMLSFNFFIFHLIYSPSVSWWDKFDNSYLFLQ